MIVGFSFPLRVRDSGCHLNSSESYHLLSDELTSEIEKFLVTIFSCFLSHKFRQTKFGHLLDYLVAKISNTFHQNRNVPQTNESLLIRNVWSLVLSSHISIYSQKYF